MAAATTNSTVHNKYNSTGLVVDRAHIDQRHFNTWSFQHDSMIFVAGCSCTPASMHTSLALTSQTWRLLSNCNAVAAPSLVPNPDIQMQIHAPWYM